MVTVLLIGILVIAVAALGILLACVVSRGRPTLGEKLFWISVVCVCLGLAAPLLKAYFNSR